MKRRQYIVTISTGTALGIAGCSSDSDGGSSDTPESTSNNDNNSNTPQNTEQENTETSQNAEQSSSEAEFEPRIILPETVELGDTYSAEVEVSNTGGQTGTWTGTIEGAATGTPEPTDSTEWGEREIELEIPAGESRTWESEGSTVDGPGVLHYRFKDGDGEIQSITVPTSKEPIIQNVNLISEWNSFGDVIDNEISSAQIGDAITIGARYWYWSENQSVEAFRQFEVYNQSGERVGIDTSTFEQVTQSNGWQQWESYSTFYTSDWTSGTHTAEVTFRDEQNQEVSESGTAEFELY